MSDAELAAIEATWSQDIYWPPDASPRAVAADARNRENVLRLIAEVRRLRALANYAEAEYVEAAAEAERLRNLRGVGSTDDHAERV